MMAALWRETEEGREGKRGTGRREAIKGEKTPKAAAGIAAFKVTPLVVGITSTSSMSMFISLPIHTMQL